MKNQKRNLAKLLSLALTAALLAGMLLATASAAENASGSKYPGVFQLHFTVGSQNATTSAFYVADGEKAYIVSDSVVKNQGADSFTLTGLGGSIRADYLGADNDLAYFKADELGNYQPWPLASTPADEVKLQYIKKDNNGAMKLQGMDIDLRTCKTEDDVVFDIGRTSAGDLYLGMPVISSDGKVVGSTYVTGENRNLMIFRFVGSTYRFASQYALSAASGGQDGSNGQGGSEDPEDPGEEKQSEDNTKLYLIVGAAAVAALLFYKKKKDGKKPQQPSEGSISLDPSGSSPAGGTIPAQNADQPGHPLGGQDIYGPTVPNPSANPQPSAPQSPQLTSPAPEMGTVPLALWQLRGVEGPLHGKVYPLRGSLTIGRGAQCDVRFSQDAPGISGMHCQVSVQDGKVYLQDLGSSYGTFYPQSNRLNPKTDCLLHEGEVFTLAQGGGAFRLEKAGAAVAADAGCIVIKDMNGRLYKSGASMRITLGRNPDCQGGFGSGEISVSGRHCELYREGGKLYLRDLDSTNGTFFSQQERLRPNEPYRIRKGMAFFLTTPKYTFVVVEE